jgi:hypothetical protein
VQLASVFMLLSARDMSLDVGGIVIDFLRVPLENTWKATSYVRTLTMNQGVYEVTMYVSDGVCC